MPTYLSHHSLRPKSHLVYKSLLTSCNAYIFYIGFTGTVLVILQNKQLLPSQVTTPQISALSVPIGLKPAINQGQVSHFRIETERNGENLFSQFETKLVASVYKVDNHTK